METMTSAVHANQLPNETMTQCVHRMRDNDETMTHEVRDQVETANTPAPAQTGGTTTNDASTPDMSWSIPDLKDYASTNNIPLGSAKTKADILAVLNA